MPASVETTASGSATRLTCSGPLARLGMLRTQTNASPVARMDRLWATPPLPRGPGHSHDQAHRQARVSSKGTLSMNSQVIDQSKLEGFATRVMGDLTSAYT